MPSPSLPAENHDLISLVASNRRRFIRKWILLTAVFLIPAVAFFSPAADLYGIPVAILLFLGLLLCPFFISGGWDMVTDQAFTGTVESMKFSVRIDMTGVTGNVTVKSAGSRKRVVRSHSNGQVNYCTLHVVTDEGSCKTLTLRLPGDTEDFPLKAGDRIVKYRGLPFPAVVGCKTPFCVVCGQVDAPAYGGSKGTCRRCDSSLIVLPLE